MNDTSVNSIVDRSLNNLIHREIGCFTDEIVSANHYHFLIDDSLKSSFNQLQSHLKADNLKWASDYQSELNVSSKDVLVIVTTTIDNNYIEKAAKTFKEKGARVIAVTKNWSTHYDDFIHERIGVSIHNEEYLSEKELNRVFVSVLDSIQNNVIKRLNGISKVL